MKNFKLSGLFTILIAVLFNSCTGSVLASAVGASPQSGALVMNGLGLMPQIAQWIDPTVKMAQGMFFTGLYKEIWLQGILDGFYPNGSFLTRSEDASVFIENESINLAEIGVTPEVYKNWDFSNPIPTVVTSDINYNLPLSRFDSQNTRIKNKDKIETNYQALLAYVQKHKLTIRTRCEKDAIYNWCPTQNGTNTPVLQATGANNGAGLKRLTFEDLLNLSKELNDRDLPNEGRVMVLTPQHLRDLQIQDLQFFKGLTDLQNGAMFKFANFDFYLYSKNPNFNKGTGVKEAFGAVPTANSVAGSVFYLESEVLRADGDFGVHFKPEDNDNEYRSDTIGFHRRALYLPKRGKGLGAIYSPTA